MKLNLLKQQIDYDTLVTGQDLDYDTYNLKFKMWDYVIKNRLFSRGDKDAISLLRDPTLYSYAFFKDDDNTPFKFTVYQDAIANCNHDFTENNPNRLVLFKSSNQTGKSRLLDSMAIQKVFNEDNVNVVMVSNNLQASQFLLSTIRHILNNSKFSETWRMNLGETANTTMLTFIKDGGKVINRIICRPSGEGLLGYPVHYLFLDEADFYEDAKRFFWKVAYPRTAKTKGQIILFSNPNPDIARSDSILWELWNGDLCRRKFSFNFLDAPWNTQSEFDRLKKQYPSYYFQSTFLGEFSIDAGGFFKQSELDRMLVKDWENDSDLLPIVDRPVYLGIDFGKARDNTVLALGYVTDDDPYKLIVRYIKQYELGTDYKDIIQDVRSIYDHYHINYHGVGGIAFDATGVGGALSEFFDDKGLSYTDIIWTQQNKSKLYGDFKLLAEQDRIKVVYSDGCYRQLAGLVFKRTPRGYLTMENSKTTVHDDYPDAISLLIAVSIKPMTVTPGVKILG